MATVRMRSRRPAVLALARLAGSSATIAPGDFYRKARRARAGVF
jgi:hypothetical protein